jgi:hypothetical protein
MVIQNEVRTIPLKKTCYSKKVFKNKKRMNRKIIRYKIDNLVT